MLSILKGKSRKIKEPLRNTNAPKREAKDTILNNIKIHTHVNTPKAKGSINLEYTKHNPKSAPMLVETPLPPLNLRNILQLCPTTEKAAMDI